MTRPYQEPNEYTEDTWLDSQPKPRVDTADYDRDMGLMDHFDRIFDLASENERITEEMKNPGENIFERARRLNLEEAEAQVRIGLRNTYRMSSILAGKRLSDAEIEVLVENDLKGQRIDVRV
jgi:hypothetical protein